MLEILNDELELNAVDKIEDMCEIPAMVVCSQCGDCYKISLD